MVILFQTILIRHKRCMKLFCRIPIFAAFENPRVNSSVVKWFRIKSVEIKYILEPNTKISKTVLLREHKRHTTRRLASTSSAVLTRGGGGNTRVLSWLGEGIPVLSCPGGGGVPQDVPPTWDWGSTNWDWGTPCLGLGYLPPGTGVPPHLGLGYHPGKGPGTTHWGTPEITWDQWKYYGI